MLTRRSLFAALAAAAAGAQPALAAVRDHPPTSNGELQDRQERLDRRHEYGTTRYPGRGRSLKSSRAASRTRRY